MTRRIFLISSVLVAVVLGLMALVTLVCHKLGSKVTVSFVNAESSHGQFPLYEESVRLAFAVHNFGAWNASVDVCSLEDEQGNWSPSLHMLGEVGPRQSAQLYLYLPQGSHPKSLRMRVNKSANVLQKAQIALKLLLGKITGRYRGKEFWFPRVMVPEREFTLSLRNDFTPNRGANQVLDSETNYNTATVGSRR